MIDILSTRRRARACPPSLVILANAGSIRRRWIPASAGMTNKTVVPTQVGTSSSRPLSRQLLIRNLDNKIACRSVIQPRDAVFAMLEHRTLIDRALVSDLAAIERRR